jgi:hypothetical protein
MLGGEAVEKVLLASGISPRLKAFQYASEFCAYIKADLNILQVIKMANPKDGLRMFRNKAGLWRRRIEDSMIAATFAEAGEHEMASEIISRARKNLEPMLDKVDETGINYQLNVKTGDPGKEILNYLINHREIVLTVLDIQLEKEGSSKKNSIPREITAQSPVPVVVVH